MKRLFLLSIALAYGCSLSAQIPAGYYDAATGYTGYALKSKLCNIISLGHVDHGYSNLYNGYTTTDVDHYFENDNTVLDIYSENPNGADAYTYSYSVSGDRCGNYSSEGDCFNREHLIPQSLFNSNAPMKNDIQFVVPTDGKVNGMRGNYPFGQVNNPTWTSTNGSKLGPNSAAGYSGTVFEPIDEFKGDIARATFYFVTRYQNSIPSFSSGNILDGTSTRGLLQWQVDLLLQWHHQDPVSQRETDRNDAVYAYQGNRNPYIDHPEFVDCIWGNTNCGDTGTTSLQEDLATRSYIDLYPNPASKIVHLRIDPAQGDALQYISVYGIDGREVWSHQIYTEQSYQEQIDLQQQPAGIYILKIKTAKGLSVRRLMKQ